MSPNGASFPADIAFYFYTQEHATAMWDFAQNVKSLPMMMETLAASAGTGWTDTFEIVLGNVTEATELFSYLTGEIGGFTEASAEARNGQLQLWKDMGGRTALFDALQVILLAGIARAAIAASGTMPWPAMKASISCEIVSVPTAEK